MLESALPFSSWESFYVIIGSSGAALTGLNFVVIALGAESRTSTPTPAAVRAFATPTIVHFCAVLLVSALLSAPWRTPRPVDLAFWAIGIAGVVYVLVVMWHAVHQSDYKPVLEDWIWHGVLPLIAYGSVLVAAILLHPPIETALFVVGGASLLLLFIGIHNAWDSVIWMATKPEGDRKPPA